MHRLKTVLILQLEGESARIPSTLLSAAGWQGQSGLSAGTAELWQLVECPEVSTNGDWEKHVYKCSTATHVKWLGVSIRKSGANHKSPAVNSPYPRELFLMT